jgi:Domain of unknown function (DUF4388)
MSEQQRMQGEFTRDSLPALLQYFALLNSTGELLLRSVSNAAAISLNYGRVVDARSRTRAGQAAFFEAMGFESGKFAFRPGSPTQALTITDPLDRLLLESSYQRDVQRMTVDEPLIEPDSVLVVSGHSSAEKLTLDPAQLRLIMQSNAERNAAQIASALGLSLDELRAVALKLFRMGLLEIRAPKRSPLAPAFVEELHKGLVTIVGPVAKLVAEDAAADVGVGLNELDSSKLRAFFEALDRMLDAGQRERFKAIKAQLTAKFG